MAEEMGVEDLVTAATKAYRWRQAHEDLRTYFRQRYELLREQLACPTSLIDRVDHPGDANAKGLNLLLVHTVAAIADIPNPFSNFLVGPPSVNDAYQRHGAALAGAQRSLEASLITLAIDLLEELDPGIGSRTTTYEALLDAGLPPHTPDPIDYW